MVGLVCLVYLALARSSVSCRTWRWWLLPCCAGDGWMSRQVSASTSCSRMQCWSFSVFQLGKFGQYVPMKCRSSIRLIHIWRVLIVWPAGCCQEGRWSWRLALAGETFLPILFKYLKIFLVCWWLSYLGENCEMCWNLSLFWCWYLAHMSNRMFHLANAIFLNLMLNAIWWNRRLSKVITGSDFYSWCRYVVFCRVYLYLTCNCAHIRRWHHQQRQRGSAAECLA
jgi:hypothetical protein